MQSALIALLDDLTGILGINDLDKNIIGNIAAMLFLIRHYLKDQEALFALVTVADRVTFADEGLFHKAEILTLDGGKIFRVCHLLPPN